MINLKTFFKNNLVKNTFLYTLSDGINKAFSFLLIPFVSFYIMPEELGIVTNFQVLYNFLLILAGQAVVNSIPYFFYNMTKKEIGLLVSNILFLIILLNILFSVIIIVFHHFIQNYLQIGLLFQLLTVINVVCALTTNLNMTIFRMENLSKRFVFLQIFQTILNIILVIIFIVILKWSAKGKIYSLVITAAVTGIINIFFLFKRKYLVFIFDKASILKALKFGIPLLPHSLSFWLKSGIDKILITTYYGLGANGLYSMALSVCSIYTLFSNAFNNAYLPYLQKRISLFTEETIATEKKRIVKQSYFIAFGFIILWGLAVFFSWICITYVINKRYKDSFQYIPLLLLGQVFHGFYSLAVNYIYNAKKTFGLGIITFSCSIFHIILSYIFIRNYGPNGAVISACSGSLLTFIFVWIYSNHVYSMPWFNAAIGK